MISLRLPSPFAIGTCVLASLLAAPTLVCADTLAETSAKVVHFADLNINNRQGAEELYRRIQGAARDVCGPREYAGSRTPSSAWQACMADAVKTAVQKVDRPLLTAYYDEHDGRRIQRPLVRTAASN
jgi:UrcA family protein